jgi:hypothetical protein
VDDAFAFRTAIHAGTHLVSFGTWLAGWGSMADGERVLNYGKELILHAWHKDRAWVETRATRHACSSPINLGLASTAFGPHLAPGTIE